MLLSEININDIEKQVYLKYSNGHLNRFNHVIGVKKMAIKLAEIYKEDKNKASIAAILHDYCKYETKEDLEKHLTNKDELEECRKYPFLFHAYASAIVAKDVFKIEDEDIINAIHNHVFGRVNMSLLEKIIMISDYTEENRTYHDCIECRKILLEKGLDEAICYSLEKTIEHVEEVGDKPHPIQLKLLKEYKEKIK